MRFLSHFVKKALVTHKSILLFARIWFLKIYRRIICVITVSVNSVNAVLIHLIWNIRMFLKRDHVKSQMCIKSDLLTQQSAFHCIKIAYRTWQQYYTYFSHLYFVTDVICTWINIFSIVNTMFDYNWYTLACYPFRSLFKRVHYSRNFERV